MEMGGAASTGVARFLAALKGDVVAPPATGVTFIEPHLLAGDDSAADPAESLAAACRTQHLDFAFVSGQARWSESAIAALRDVGAGSAWVVPGVFGALLDPALPVEGLKAIARGGYGIPRTLDAALDIAIAEAGRGTRAGASAIVVADDMAGSHGPLADPAFLEEQVFSRLARIAGVARTAAVPAILHCDGDAGFLMSFAARAGFEAIHGDTGGPSGVERALVAARVAGLAFIGGVPTAELVGEPRPELERWRERALARGRGLLLADDGGVTTHDEAAALLAILRAHSAGVR
jgi:hypothetical protein